MSVQVMGVSEWVSELERAREQAVVYVEQNGM